MVGNWKHVCRLRFQSALHVFVAYLVSSLILTNQVLSVHQPVLMKKNEKAFLLGSSPFCLAFLFPVIEVFG